MLFPLKLAGRTNSLRYHQGTMKGLSCCIAILEKFAPIGYVTPGRDRRFIPKNGSGYTFCFTNAANTVVGTLAAYQSFGWNAGVERVSPFSATLHEDCRRQPSRRKRVASGCTRPIFDSCDKTTLEKDSTTMSNRVLLFLKGSFAWKN